MLMLLRNNGCPLTPNSLPSTYGSASATTTDLYNKLLQMEAHGQWGIILGEWGCNDKPQLDGMMAQIPDGGTLEYDDAEYNSNGVVGLRIRIIALKPNP
jgi:hypothetical protein